MYDKRKKAQDRILKSIGLIDKSGINVELYQNLFDKLTDKDFHTFMENLRDDKVTLSIIVPDDDSVKIDMENNFKVGKKLGVNFFQQLKVTGDKDLPDYITPKEYLIYKLPIKRAAQLLSKKISIPKDDKSRDLLTGQVTGKSRSSKLTKPELEILIGMGLKDSVVELMKARGGDLGEAHALNEILYKQGSVTQEELEAYSDGVRSTRTLNTYFNAMHIKSTLNK